MSIDSTDRAIIEATQCGLPLTPQPYHAIALQLELTVEEVMARLQAMQERGVIRRIGAVPNHYKLGYSANGMSVWDVDDERIGDLGPKIGALDCVSHCYRRPRIEGRWRFNLFAMVHGRTKDEVARGVARIADVLGPFAYAHDVLFSRRILKKTGLRLSGRDPRSSPSDPDASRPASRRPTT